MTKQNLSKTYDPKEFETRIYEMWENTGAFNADIDKNKKPFTIVMPPPNITGRLHMGHALDQTLQDILIRFKRMQGFSALWIPGSDHASIATEVKVAEKLYKDTGKEKSEIGREEFLKHAWKWKEEYGGMITEQCRRLGISPDWRQERFTMDEGCNKAVTKFFVNLYKKGQIYRGNRIINWCPSCMTSLSDAEVNHEDVDGNYWYFRYDSKDNNGESIIIATSRPETMFGDVAIAVHPSDERYRNMIGKKVLIPIIEKEIEIIEDEYPDPEKGTGAVKITPAHDANDFAVGERHNLEIVSCMNKDGTMNEYAGKYKGLDRYECRKLWVKELSEAGYLVKIEKKTIPVGKCYRCHTPIEDMISEQWFLKMEELAKPAINAVKSGDLIHVPERFEKIYLNWLNDIHDWCISRQLWWGHRIPAYYCGDCNELIVSESEPANCPKCGSSNVVQDDDVLDTWFSSALWPFSTLGWPEETEALKYFYPTSVLVTGYDILFFWVIRMVFSGLEAMGEVPFKYVFLHGLVRDEEGRKMSKSLGNGIDPIEVIEEVGADALRFMLSTGITPGNDMRFLRSRLEASRNFANKLWNASRFVIMNLQDDEENCLEIADERSIKLKSEDQWILDEINEAVKYITASIEKYEIGLAGQRVHELIRDEFCDWYIEFAKKRLYGKDENDKMTARFVLLNSLRNLLKLLHPFMPFITEEIWSALPEQAAGSEYLITSSWPVYEERPDYKDGAVKTRLAMEIIKAVRNIRAEADAAPSRKLNLIIFTDVHEKAISEMKETIRSLANLSNIEINSNNEKRPKDSMTRVISGAELFVPLKELIDFDLEIERLEKENKHLINEIKRAEGKLSNEGFVSKAPKKLIDEEKEKLIKYREMQKAVIERLNLLKEDKNK